MRKLLFKRIFARYSEHFFEVHRSFKRSSGAGQRIEVSVLGNPQHDFTRTFDDECHRISLIKAKILPNVLRNRYLPLVVTVAVYRLTRSLPSRRIAIGKVIVSCPYHAYLDRTTAHEEMSGR